MTAPARPRADLPSLAALSARLHAGADALWLDPDTRELAEVTRHLADAVVLARRRLARARERDGDADPRSGPAGTEGVGAAEGPEPAEAAAPIGAARLSATTLAQRAESALRRECALVCAEAVLAGPAAGSTGRAAGRPARSTAGRGGGQPPGRDPSVSLPVRTDDRGAASPTSYQSSSSSSPAPAGEACRETMRAAGTGAASRTE